MKFRNNKKSLIFFILFSFFLQDECFASKADKYYIVGLSKSGIKKTLSKINLKSFQHPAVFKDKDLYKILTSLYYSDYMREVLLWEQRKNPLFHPKEAKKITPLIRRSLEKSTPGQMVYFSIGKSNKKTAGNIFFANSKLYFYLQTIKGKEIEWKGTGGKPHDQWKLVPQKDQNYLRKEVFLGLEDTYTDWLIVEISKKKQNKGAEPPVLVKTKRDYKEIEKELRFLKKMEREGLITKEEYKKKKEKLLDKL